MALIQLNLLYVLGLYLQHLCVYACIHSLTWSANAEHLLVPKAVLGFGDWDE